MHLFKNRLLWLGAVGAFVVMIVFGLAMMGTTAGIKPKDLPVALVVADEGTALPGSDKRLEIGKLIAESLAKAEGLPVKWIQVASEEEALLGMDAREYYGALVLPADLSAGVASVMSPSPKSPVVTAWVNEGMNTQASAAVRQVLKQGTDMIKVNVSRMLLEQIGQAQEAIPVATAGALLQPFAVQEQIAHPVGANNASGNAPNLLTQILWMACLVSSITLFLATGKTIERGGNRFAAIAAQSVFGVVFAAASAWFALWMAGGWYGMQIDDKAGLWLFLWLAASALFLIQSGLLHWLGFAAVPLLVLLLFFSMPIMGMAPESLSDTTRDWLYSWTPFRFVASGAREWMYFGGAGNADASVLAWIAAGCGALLLASGFMPAKRKPNEAGVKETAV